VADIIDKLVANPPAFHTQYILSTRTFGQAEAVALAQALRCNTTLRELYASGHDIGVEGATAVGASLAENATLLKLCLGHAEFGTAGLQALCDGGLNRNTALKMLDLEFKGLSSAGAAPIAGLLRAHPALSELLLSRNTLGDEGAALVCEGLRDCPSLTSLDLSFNSLGVTAAAAVGAAAGSLASLNLSGNPLGEAGGAALAAGLLQSGAAGGEAAAGALPMQQLWLCDCALGNTAAAALAGWLSSAGGCGLRSLHFENKLTADNKEGTTQRSELDGELGGGEDDANMANCIGTQGATALAAALGAAAGGGAEAEAGAGAAGAADPAAAELVFAFATERSRLQALNLRGNCVRAEGALALARAVRACGALTSLDVSANGTGLGSAVALLEAACCGAPTPAPGNAAPAGAEAGGAGCNLRELCLFNDGLNEDPVGAADGADADGADADAGPRALAAALTPGCPLRALDLGANGFSFAGSMLVVRAAEAAAALKTLEMGGNELGLEGEAELEALKERRPDLDVARDKPREQAEADAHAGAAEIFK
jgi:hypothetical protein